jgi:glutathione S-transferase
LAGPVTLHGYACSVYTRIARAALAAKGVEHELRDIDPFENENADRLRRLHPFLRVPILDHGGFRVFETSAITRYVDLAFEGISLSSGDPPTQTRIAQCVAVIDAYGYRPMIRQVFEHRVFRPREGLACDEAEVAAGVAASAPVLDVLDGFAREGLILSGESLSLADLHVGPMLDCFVTAPEGRAMLETRRALAGWWARFSEAPCMRLTRPPLH